MLLFEFRIAAGGNINWNIENKTRTTNNFISKHVLSSSNVNNLYNTYIKRCIARIFTQTLFQLLE